MKKIGLFLSSEPLVGGTFQYNLSILEAVSALPKDQFEVTVVYTNRLWIDYLKDYAFTTIYVDERDGFVGRLLSKLLRISGLPVSLYRKICHRLHPVARKVFQQKCHLWLFPSQDDWTYQIPVPAVGTIHDLMHRYEKSFPELSEGGEYQHREYRYSNMCRWAIGILVDSQVGKEQVMESYYSRPDQVHILPFIGPKYIYHTSEQPRSFKEVQQQYDLPSKYLFYPAQFWEHKNHKGLVRAVALLKERYPDLQLVLSGSFKNGYQSTRDLVQQLELTDRVHFINYVPNVDMPLLYANARAMIMPTFLGPTNIPPIEAIALGCPVAVAKVYGMPEQLGNAALYFDPALPEDIAQVIGQIWEDDTLCRDLSERGLKRSREWTQEHFSARFHKIIETIL